MPDPRPDDDDDDDFIDSDWLAVAKTLFLVALALAFLWVIAITF